MEKPRVLSSEESFSLTHLMESAIKHAKQNREQREDRLDSNNWSSPSLPPDVTELQDPISEIKSLFSSYIEKNSTSFEYIHNLLFDFLFCYCEAEISSKPGLLMNDILPWLDSAVSEVLVRTTKPSCPVNAPSTTSLWHGLAGRRTPVLTKSVCSWRISWSHIWILRWKKRNALPFAG